MILLGTVVSQQGPSIRKETLFKIQTWSQLILSKFFDYLSHKQKMKLIEFFYNQLKKSFKSKILSLPKDHKQSKKIK
jgi:ABC-type transporter MlaC component